MKKVLAFVAVAAFLVSIGCGAMGAYTQVKAPGHFAAGATGPGGSKITGESCATNILGIIFTGDYSVDAALQAAGAEGKTLKNVTVDHPTLNILGLFGKYCTQVNAEVAQ